MSVSDHLLSILRTEFDRPFLVKYFSLHTRISPLSERERRPLDVFFDGLTRGRLKLKGHVRSNVLANLLAHLTSWEYFDLNDLIEDFRKIRH